MISVDLRIQRDLWWVEVLPRQRIHCLFLCGKNIKRQALDYIAQDVEIVPALLGNQAGFIGAARLVTQRNN